MALLTRRYAGPMISRMPDISSRENFRLEPLGAGLARPRRDPVEPVPVGTIVVRMFRIVEYRQDCDGSLMACLEEIDSDGNITGWTVNNIGIHPSSCWVLASPATLDQLATQPPQTA